MKSIEKTFFWKAIVKTQQAVLIITSACIVLIIVAGVFTRYVLKVNIFGIEEIIVIVAMWLYWIASVHASYENSHLRADIIEHLIKSKNMKKLFSVTVQLITIVAIAFFTKWGIDYAMWNIQISSTTPGLRLPMIISQLPVSLCFVMMLLYSIYHLIRTIFPRKSSGAEEVGM